MLRAGDKKSTPCVGATLASISIFPLLAKHDLRILVA
jgi:hypothetical protein